MVPNGWKKTHLKCVISGAIKNGYSPLPASTTTGYWVLSLGALTDHGINPLEIKPVVVDEKVKQALLSDGDFLISRSNTPDKVGRSIRFKNEVQNCSYPDLMMRFCVDTQKADPNFIEIKLKSAEVRQYYKSCAAGSSSSMVKINKAVVENTPLLLPSFPEQKKIAQVLSTWDRAISTTEQLLANSQQQKKALMQQLLTGKKRLLDKNGVRFSGEWKLIKLANICSINPLKSPEPEDGAVSFVSMDSVSNDAKLLRTEKKQYTDVSKGFTSFVNHDVLVAKITPCFENGKGAFVDGLINGIGFGSTEFHVLRASKGTSAEYLYYLTNTSEFRVRGEANMQGSAGQKRVTTDYLKGLKIYLPLQQEEQNKIAAVLSAVDQEIEALQRKLDCLKQEKKALMQQLLMGKRRVKLDDKVVA